MAGTSKTKDEGIVQADVSALNGTDNLPQDGAPAYVPSGDANDPISAKFEDGEGGEPFVSEGMRHDLYLHGKAVDPASGRMVVRA